MKDSGKKLNNFEKTFGFELKSFFNDIWEEKCISSSTEILGQLDQNLTKSVLEWSDDSLISALNNQILLLKESKVVSIQIFKKNDGFWDLGKLRNVLALDYTCYLRKIDTVFPKIKKIMDAINKEIYPLVLQANFFNTPSNQKGLMAHFDSHDVIVMQTKGQKNWNIWPAYRQDMTCPYDPEQDLPYVKKYTDQTDPLFRKKMSVGETFYLPRGVIHQPQAINESNHISFWLKSPLISDEITSENSNNFREAYHESYRI